MSGDENWWDDRTMPNDEGPDWHRDAEGILWQVDPRTGERWKRDECWVCDSPNLVYTDAIGCCWCRECFNRLWLE